MINIKRRYKIAIVLIAIMSILIGVFLGYIFSYYEADVAIETISKTNEIKTEDNMTILSPSTPSHTAFIFYPGAKVEETAYLPLLNQLCEKGITCILIKMPFNLAIFNVNAADNVFTKLPDIKNWYIGGHSLGGAMASSYASKNLDKINGVILLGAYIYGEVPAEKALIIYGSNDEILDKSKLTTTENTVIIPGGNHAYFGNYGEQKGDGAGSISREEQQKRTVEAILNFI